MKKVKCEPIIIFKVFGLTRNDKWHAFVLNLCMYFPFVFRSRFCVTTVVFLPGLEVVVNKLLSVLSFMTFNSLEFV